MWYAFYIYCITSVCKQFVSQYFDLTVHHIECFLGLTYVPRYRAGARLHMCIMGQSTGSLFLGPSQALILSGTSKSTFTDIRLLLIREISKYYLTFQNNFFLTLMPNLSNNEKQREIRKKIHFKFIIS